MLRPQLSINYWHLLGSRNLNLTGTRSHCTRLWPRRSEAEVVPPHSFQGHMTSPRRLQGHSQSAALHAQWAPGCEATSCHSRVPTLKM
ncbi:unnamed protein product, partial [Staurois parvus]